MFKWLAKKIRHAQNELDSQYEVAGNTPLVRSVDHHDFDNGMNFIVYRADGGHVVQVRQYDRKTDRTNSGLHVITDDKDLGEELGKIFVFQNLRG